MYENLSLFKTASALARHSAMRQALIAENIANADTPGYAAKDLPEFKSTMPVAGLGIQMVTTAPGHMTGVAGQASVQAATQLNAGDESPNGNTVSVETEMVKSSEVRQQHQLALAVYRGGMDLLRTALGRR
jgi:flagellar basal-body rod protein FlgB